MARNHLGDGGHLALGGPQVCDVAFLNAHDPREGFHVGQTIALNMIEGVGDMRRITKLYSRPPYENVLLTVVDDPVGVHAPWLAGRCSARVLEVRARAGVPEDPARRTCQQNLEEALAELGIDGDLVPDVFNVFMNVDAGAAVAEGRFEVLPPVAKQGDYIDLRAEIDVVAVVSACPAVGVVNDGVPKRLGLEVLAGPDASP